MEIKEIISLAITLFIFAGTVVSFIVALVKKVKQYKKAKTEAEKEFALNDMKTVAQGFIQDVEKLYEDYTQSLVGTGSTVSTSVKSGSLKKESVMSKLSQYALEKGYSFDSEYWSGVIDELVAMTKSVNVKTAA